VQKILDKIKTNNETNNYKNISNLSPERRSNYNRFNTFKENDNLIRKFKGVKYSSDNIMNSYNETTTKFKTNNLARNNNIISK